MVPAGESSIALLVHGSCSTHALRAGVYHHEEIRVPAGALERYERLIDLLREEAAVLRRVSAEFELCADGLGQVRREWERARGVLSQFAGRLIQ
jgi:hypothetical protein